MLGMTDFFDDPPISSTTPRPRNLVGQQTGGRLGRLVKPVSPAAAADGRLQYIQGIGMFRADDTCA